MGVDYKHSHSFVDTDRNLKIPYHYCPCLVEGCWVGSMVSDQYFYCCCAENGLCSPIVVVVVEEVVDVANSKVVGGYFAPCLLVHSSEDHYSVQFLLCFLQRCCSFVDSLNFADRYYWKIYFHDLGSCHPTCLIDHLCLYYHHYQHQHFCLQRDHFHHPLGAHDHYFSP